MFRVLSMLWLIFLTFALSLNYLGWNLYLHLKLDSHSLVVSAANGLSHNVLVDDSQAGLIAGDPYFQYFQLNPVQTGVSARIEQRRSPMETLGSHWQRHDGLTRLDFPWVLLMFPPVFFLLLPPRRKT
ncbi:MAG: hypothetical protein E1N59_2288 [Puniceicoccaceae bacterium 5H]|nr:MAG: hypothetical protein E1N59_2288 [Puniceicoccaceae bacterium 5H]